MAEVEAAIDEQRLLSRQWLIGSQSARVTAIVHVPSTLRYHCRVLVGKSGGHPLQYSAKYDEVTVVYSQQQQRWFVSSTGFNLRGLRAVNIGDNVVQDEQKWSDASWLLDAPTNLSSKQRYIDLLQCSEHVHNHCHRLLPSSPPLPVMSDRCNFWSTAHCYVHRNIHSATDHRLVRFVRCSSTEFEVCSMAAGFEHRFRASIHYRPGQPAAASETGGKGRKDSRSKVRASEAEGLGWYEMVAEYGAPAMCTMLLTTYRALQVVCLFSRPCKP